MKYEISRSYAPNSMVDQQPKKENRTTEGNQVEWLMNSCTFLGLVRFSHFYKEFGVSLPVRCHYHHRR